MLITILLSAVMMAGLFLMLYAGVALIQDKKYFTSAPKEVREAVQPRKERFPGAHALGGLLAILSIVMMLGAVVCGGIDGIRHGFTMGQLFLRFLIMLWGLKAYDILFFDWFLLCRSNFFPRYYPETKKHLGPHLFGFNKKEHITHIVLSSVVALVLAWICTLMNR